MRLREGFGLFNTPSSYARNGLSALCPKRAVAFFFSPKMKSVRENKVAHDAPWIVVTKIERWVELEVGGDVAGETDGRRIFRTALPINLHAPPFIEVVGVAEDRFVFVGSMDSDDDLVMLGIIAGFDNGWGSTFR